MVGILSDIGNVRKSNEDYADYFEDGDKRIYVIADGMGGHNAGEVASFVAVKKIIDFVKNNPNDEDMESTIKESIYEANDEIYKMSKKKSELKGMGTTITLCFIVKDDMVIGNVGDSSCYIVKDDGIFKVTKDHSLVQQLIDNGSITEEEAKVHPNKNIITRALGTETFVKVDTFKMSLDGIKKVILCTDGLTNELTISEIYDIVINNDEQEACRKMIELSKLRGGRDNISVIVFEGEGKK